MPQALPMVSARVKMWTLLGSTSLSFMLTRLTLPQLIPLIAAELGLTDAQTGLLLGSFFPGYVLGMTPSGVLCRVLGAKNVLSMGQLGNAASMALLPVVVARGVYPTSALLVVKGLCQSCLESTHTTFKRCWMPRRLGSERVWAVRVTRWGQFLGQMAASLITPWIATRCGWRTVPLSFGCATGLYAVIWHFAAAETPMHWRGQMSDAEKRLLLESDEMKATAAFAGAGADLERKGSGGFPFHLLRYPSCVVPMLLHVGNNCSQYTLQYWGPTILSDMFAASPQQQGNIIFAATLASVLGSFAVAGFENLMLGRLGLSLLAVRRGCGSLGCILQSCSMLMFGMTRSPLQAILAYSLHNLFQCVTVDSGVLQNYIDVGAEDCGSLIALGNTFANLAGPVTTSLGVILRRKTGGWMALLYVMASWQVFAAFTNWKFCGVTRPDRAPLQ